MKEKSYYKFVFNLGLIILLFIFNNILISSLGFIVHKSIMPCNFILSIFLTLIVSIIIMYKNGYKLIHYISSLVLLAILVGLSIFASARTFDTSWDGNSYHKAAIGQLKNGWNPVYQSIEEFNESENNPLELKEPCGLWNNHYAKGYWIFSANIYSITDNIETGKSFAILIAISTFLILAGFFITKTNYFLGTLLSLLLVVNPIFLAQALTFYNDGILGLMLLVLIVSLIMIIDKNSKFKQYEKYILFFLSLTILINIKFSGFAYAGIYSLVFYIFIIFNKQLRKKEFWPMTLTAIFALIISLLIIGLSTYPKNLIEHKNPFYPIFGENKVDIMTPNQPKGFENKNNIEKFLIANFSKSNSTTEKPILKIPFTFDKNEINKLVVCDLRTAGYGVLFSGILVLSFITVIVGLILLHKKDKSKFWMYILPIIATLILILFLGESWWARYLPQLYALPIISILLLNELKTSKTKNALKWLIIILLILNMCIFISLRYKIKSMNFKSIRNEINNIKQIPEDKLLYVSTENFDGAIYSLFDYHYNIKVVDHKDDMSKYRKSTFYLNYLNTYDERDL
ncbi:MAG: hypothetical protein RR359_05760 [Bacilli bacterium]